MSASVRVVSRMSHIARSVLHLLTHFGKSRRTPHVSAMARVLVLQRTTVHRTVRNKKSASAPNRSQQEDLRCCGLVNRRYGASSRIKDRREKIEKGSAVGCSAM